MEKPKRVILKESFEHINPTYYMQRNMPLFSENLKDISDDLIIVNIEQILKNHSS